MGEKEAVKLSLGFTMQTEHDDPRGIRLSVEETDNRIIGFLYFSRAALGELMAGRAYQPGRWEQIRRGGGGTVRTDESGST